MQPFKANFSIGQLVQHKLFKYRGVVFDVDPSFLGTEEWYETVAQSRPPKEKPWYHVLVHNAAHTTYVAERNLEHDTQSEPVEHPLMEYHFDGFIDGVYKTKNRAN